MVGNLKPHSQKATIIGGGISGLLAGYYLTRSGYHVEIFEAGPRWGGLIRTRSTPRGIAEEAAHSLLVTPEVSTLFRELNIPLLEVTPSSKSRWIVRKGKMRRMPLSLLEIIGAFFRAAFVRSQPNEKLTLAHWAERHLGKPALNYLIDPMLKGIFGASPQEILVTPAFPALSIPHGRTLLGHFIRRWLGLASQVTAQPKSKMMSPREGMESLVHGIVSYLEKQPNAHLHLNHAIETLPQAENLILAVPPQKAAQLLESVDPRLAAALRGLQWSSLITTTVFLEKIRLQKIPDGVGVLMPSSENRKCLGILFNSSSFDGRVIDPENWVSLTVICGNGPKEEASDESVLKQIQDELENLFGWSGPIEHYAMTRWPKAIPIYNHPLVQALALAQTQWCSQPGQILVGNYTGEVSIRGMIQSTAVRFGHPNKLLSVGSK